MIRIKKVLTILPITLTTLMPIVAMASCKVGGGEDKPEPTPPTTIILDTYAPDYYSGGISSEKIYFKAGVVYNFTAYIGMLWEQIPNYVRYLDFDTERTDTEEVCVEIDSLYDLDVDGVSLTVQDYEINAGCSVEFTNKDKWPVITQSSILSGKICFSKVMISPLYMLFDLDNP